jgi:hypothetical protein
MPFGCSICYTKFTQGNGLKHCINSQRTNVPCVTSNVHEKKVYKNTFFPFMNKKPFECNICNVKFILKSKFSFHTASVHERKTTVVCTLCGIELAEKNIKTCMHREEKS